MTGLGQAAIWLKPFCSSRVNAVMRSSASGASRSMSPIAVRSAPTEKYFSYSLARTTTRTDASSPTSLKADDSSSTRSEAMPLLPLRCMTTVATGPSRFTSRHSPMALGREEGDAARDLERDAGDVAGLVGAEEGDRVGDVGGLPEALEDRPLLEALVDRIRLGRGLARLAADDAGHDRVGGDAVAPALQRGGLGEPDHGGLGGRVGSLPETSQRAGDRGHEDDAAEAALDHVRPCLLGAVEGARQVDLDIPVPEFVGLLGDLGDVVQGCRVVDEDVQPPELAFDLGHGLPDLVAVGDVHLDRQRLAAHLPDLFGGRVGFDPAGADGGLGEKAAGLLGRLLKVGVVLDQDVGDDHVGPGARKRQRVLAAEPAGGPGDYGYLARKVERHALSPGCEMETRARTLLPRPGPWSRPSPLSGSALRAPARRDRRALRRCGR